MENYTTVKLFYVRQRVHSELWRYLCQYCDPSTRYVHWYVEPEDSEFYCPMTEWLVENGADYDEMVMLDFS